MDVSRAFADPVGDSLTWTVSLAAPGVMTVTAAGPRIALTAVSIGSATIRVTATDPGGLSASQSFTATVADRPSAPFTDDPVRPGVTPVRAVHFTELRARIDGVRSAAGLAPFGWTDPVLRAGATPVRLVHLTELRRALTAAYTASGRTPPRWTDATPVAGTTPIPGRSPERAARRGGGPGVRAVDATAAAHGRIRRVDGDIDGRIRGLARCRRRRADVRRSATRRRRLARCHGDRARDEAPDHPFRAWPRYLKSRLTAALTAVATRRSSRGVRSASSR